MRILLLTQFFPPDLGGEELHVFNLANTLAMRGHEVAVATQCMAGVPDTEVLASGARVYRFPTMAMRLPGVYSTNRLHHLPVPDPRAVRELARIVRGERPDVIHAHNWIVNSAVALRRCASTGHRYGLVLTLHDFSHVCATKRLMRKGAVCAGPSAGRCPACAMAHYGPVAGAVTVAATAAMRQWKNIAVDHVISVSRAVAHGNHIPEGQNSSIVPNFVPDSAVLDADECVTAVLTPGPHPGLPHEPFLLFVGELSREKGLPVLLRAYESLDGHRPPLLLVGRRVPDTPVVLPPGVQMYSGWPHEQVMAAFRRSLAAVLPSVWPEPCPTTVLEAMACGRPVVTSSAGGIADIVTDEESGLLTAPGDEKGLAAAISRVVMDSDLRERLAAGALSRVRRFTATAVAERLEEIYARVAPVRSRATTAT